MTAQYDFNAGLDISALTSVTQAQLMQMVQQIAPLSNIGGIIAQSTTPDVAGNPRFSRYIWLDTTTDPAVPKYYNSGGGTWSAVTVSALSITNAEVSASAAIAVSKLAAGTARYVLRTNAAGTSPEYVTPASILNSDELAVIKLTSNGGTDGYLKSVSGVSQWVSQTTERAAIAAALSGLSPTALTPGSNNTLLGTNGSGVVTFGAIGSLLANNAIGLNLLAAGGASSKDLLKFDGSNWVKFTPTLEITEAATINGGTLGTVNLSSATLTEVFAHGFSSTPRLVRVVIRCTSNDANTGHVAGDEIELGNFICETGTQHPLIIVTSDSTNITVSRNNNASITVVPKAGGVEVAPTSLANFTPKVYAWR